MAIVLSASQRLALKANLDYWRRREEEARKHYIAEDDALEAKINSKYNYLYMQLDERINAFYSRYATAEGIDMATAQQKVSKTDIKAYSERAKQYVEAAARMRRAEANGNFALAEQLRQYVFSDEAEEAMRLYNATMKINRLELLKSQMGLDMVETFNGVQQDLGEGLDTRTLEELERQAGILGETVTTTKGRVNAIVNASFNHATWSQRIWMYQTQMRDALGTLLTDGIIQGRNPVDLARDLRKIVGGSVKNTERLLRTEMARVQTAAQENVYKEGGFEQYIFLALGTACPICRALDEQVFDIKFLDDNQFAPPVHPNCRCSTAAYVDRDEMEREVIGDEKIAEEAKIPKNDFTKLADFKTGSLTTEQYKDSIREQEFRSKKDITRSWIKENKRNGSVSEASAVIINGESKPVDGKKIVLDPSKTEREVANTLSEKYRCDVTLLPKINDPPKHRSADYLINGERYDLKSPTGSGKHTLYDNVKSSKGQAENVILNLSNCPLEDAEIEKQIREIYFSNHTLFVNRVVLYADEKILKVYERKSK